MTLTYYGHNQLQDPRRRKRLRRQACRGRPFYIPWRKYRSRYLRSFIRPPLTAQATSFPIPSFATRSIPPRRNGQVGPALRYAATYYVVKFQPSRRPGPDPRNGCGGAICNAPPPAPILIVDSTNRRGVSAAGGTGSMIAYLSIPALVASRFLGFRGLVPYGRAHDLWDVTGRGDSERRLPLI